MKRTLLVFLFVHASVFAQDGPDETFRMKNGRFWNGLASPDSQLAFLRGLMDGWELRGMTKDVVLGKELIVWRGNPKSTMGDLAEMITSVYAETENQPLPVGWAAMACLAVQRGDATRESVLMALRKHLAAQLGRSDPRPVNEIDPTTLILELRPH
jgi:hypothetical protein